MKYSKFSLRKSFLKKRKKNALKIKKIIFNFNLIFNLINKNFKKKKITIAGYYPVNYEVNILNFLKLAERKKFKISLPVISSFNAMNFKLWSVHEPLSVNKFGILEPNKKNITVVPNIVLVPLAAFDSKLNRIGYGKGYYDRKLREINKIKKNIISIGIAYSFQKCRTIPVDKNDFKLDYILTEHGIINSKK
jgi:5-formyltetrahydrofolate cyclo-ligase